MSSDTHRDEVPWSTGLCDCCENASNSLITCFCPCITFGQIAEIADRGSSSCATCSALYVILGVFASPVLFCMSAIYRSKIRRQYHLEGGVCQDWCVHFWCSPCATCQQYRELKHQGFDMHIGWQANVERMQSRAAEMAPVGQKVMNR